MFHNSFPNLFIIGLFVFLQPFHQLLVFLIEVSDLLAVIVQELVGGVQMGQALPDGWQGREIVLTRTPGLSRSGGGTGGWHPAQKQVSDDMEASDRKIKTFSKVAKRILYFYID